MRHEVTITQCNIFTIDDEDEDVVEYMNSGGTLKEYIACDSGPVFGKHITK